MGLQNKIRNNHLYSSIFTSLILFWKLRNNHFLYGSTLLEAIRTDSEFFSRVRNLILQRSQNGQESNKSPWRSFFEFHKTYFHFTTMEKKARNIGKRNVSCCNAFEHQWNVTYQWFQRRYFILLIKCNCLLQKKVVTKESSDYLRVGKNQKTQTSILNLIHPTDIITGIYSL